MISRLIIVIITTLLCQSLSFSAPLKAFTPCIKPALLDIPFGAKEHYSNCFGSYEAFTAERSYISEWYAADIVGRVDPATPACNLINKANPAQRIEPWGGSSVFYCLASDTLTDKTCITNSFITLLPNQRAALISNQYGTLDGANAACAAGTNAAATGGDIAALSKAAGDAADCASDVAYCACPRGQHLVNMRNVDTKYTQCIPDNQTCPTGYSSITGMVNGVPSTECYSSKASSVPATSSVPSTNNCPAGQNEASGNVPNPDGTTTYHLKCYDAKTGALMSDNGVNTAAGQAAADALAAAQAAADKAAADAAAKAASSASSTPNSFSASGVFYTPGTITGGKSLSDVAKNFLDQLKNTSILSYLSNFFNLSGLSGHTCPTWSVSIPFPIGGNLDMRIDFFCWDFTISTLRILGLFMLFFAAFQAYKIAFK